MGVFRYLSILSPVLPIFFFMLFKPNKSVRELWVIFFYVIFSFLEDIFLFIIHLNSKRPNLDFLLLFTLIDYAFVFAIFQLLLTSKVLKTVLTVISLLFAAYSVLLFLFANNTNAYTTTSPIESIIVLIFCIFFLFEQLNKPEELFVYSSPGFWVVLGFLVFASGTLFLDIFRIIDFAEAQKWWVINNMCNIFLNCLIALAFIINYRNAKSMNHPKKVPLFDS
jgi:hypothetical protein